MELRDYYNVNKERTGETYTADIEPDGDNYMLIVVCFIQNSKGEFLIQRASEQKGNKCGSTGGHPKSGETSIQGMFTEIKEELGICISPDKYQYINTFIGRNKIVDIYYIKVDIDITKLTLQKEEVEAVKWMSTHEIRELIKNNNFEKLHSRLFGDLEKWIVNSN